MPGARVRVQGMGLEYRWPVALSVEQDGNRTHVVMTQEEARQVLVSLLNAITYPRYPVQETYLPDSSHKREES